MSAINPKVNSLLNYRFVKKTVPKLPGGASSSDSENSQSSQTSGTPLQSSHSINSDHQNYTKTLSQDSDATILDSQATILYNDSQRDENFPDSQETIILSDGRKTPTINSVGNPDTVPETPQSGLTSPTSPVFRARSKGSRQLTVIDDSEESQEPTSSTASSPWMSKENGIITNGVSSTTAGKQRRKERQVVREEFETADDGMVNGDNTQDMDNKVQQLRAMFPSQLKTTISVALTESNGDLEKAIDLLIDGRVFLSKPKTKKRVIRHESSDSELDSSPIRKPAKRKRMISDEVTENDAQHTSHPEEAKIQYILEIFPQKSRRDISRALESNDWDTSKATLELTNENGKPQEVLGDDDKDFDSDEGADSDDSYEELQQESSNNTTVLSFFNDATREELTNTPGCSKKKAELIMTLRPFSDYRSMVDVFADNKTLGMDVIRGCMEIIRVRDVVVKLMQRCERISKDMETRVTVLTKRPDLEDEEDSDCIKIKQQPKYLSEKFQLKPFQMVGLNWLRLMHAQEVNGILADEMGLGKTIQTIAFIAHLLEEGEEGPHVVIVPSSTIENWMREFHVWCPSIDVLVYYGSQEERKLNRQNIFYNGKNDFHVILTTYNMATGSIEDRSLFKKIDFHYAIFDEGHMLKNMSSLRYQNLTKINAERRLLLTGTPLQNNLLELMSLLSFVMPDIFMGKADQLKRMFSMISKGTDDRSRFESERIMHAKRIMKPFVLRRLKSEVQKQLPRKTEQVEYCPLNPGQQEIYDKLVKKFSEAIADESIQNSRGASMLMQLRKAANHPLLIRHHFNDNVLRTMAKKIAKEPSHLERGALPDLIYQDMEEMNDSDLMRLCDQYKKYIGHLKPDLSVIGDSGKFRRLKELLEFHKSKGDRVLIFSQFTMLMDIMEQYLQQLKYSYLRMDGSTPVPDRQEMIDKYTNDESIFLFMLSTRAGGLGINLIAANVVIIHDIDFNPYNDKQAEDRCHRVGQKREVKIIRMISKGTVEEGMLRCARDKLRLEKDVTTGEEFDKENSADVASLLKDALLEKKV